MKIYVACGGTGGHVYPGLATAEELVKRGHDVVLVVAGKKIEASTLKGWSGRVMVFRAGGLAGRFSVKKAMAVFQLAFSVLRCWLVMRRDRPDAVLAMGSYASVGPILAAFLLGIPSVLHESNAIPGRAVRFLAPRVSKIALGFSSAERFFKKGASLHTGFPLRKFDKDTFRGSLLDKDLFTLFIMGGSQGARSLNQLVPAATELLKKNAEQFQVLHLSGKNDEDTVRDAYKNAGVNALVFGFLENIGKAYFSADLSISRAGAASCAEQAMFQLPSILIPLPHAIDGHQAANAAEMELQGGAIKLDQTGLTPERLADKIGELMHNKRILAEMKNALRQKAIIDGTEKLADLVESVAAKQEEI